MCANSLAWAFTCWVGLSWVLLLVGVLVPSNRRFAFAHFGLRCFPNVLEWILLLLFTLSSFPSLPLTEQGCSHGPATSTFVGFYCCGEEAIAIERALVALPERERQVRARATDGERKSVRTRNNPRIKASGFPSMTVLLFPHLACLPASTLSLLPRLPVSCPVFLTWSMAQACAGLPGLGSLSSHWRWAVFLSVFWWADEESAGAHHGDEGGKFFPQTWTWLSAFPPL